MPSNDCDIHIIHATTGELICQLILNPAIDYQAPGSSPFSNLHSEGAQSRHYY